MTNDHQQPSSRCDSDVAIAQFYKDCFKIAPRVGAMPDHYTLLGIPIFESNVERIVSACEMRFALIHRYQLGAYSEVAIKIRAQLASAMYVLSDKDRKHVYDTELEAQVSPPALGTHSPKIARASTEQTGLPIGREQEGDDLASNVAHRKVGTELEWQFESMPAMERRGAALALLAAHAVVPRIEPHCLELAKQGIVLNVPDRECSVDTIHRGYCEMIASVCMMVAQVSSYYRIMREAMDNLGVARNALMDRKCEMVKEARSNVSQSHAVEESIIAMLRSGSRRRLRVPRNGKGVGEWLGFTEPGLAQHVRRFGRCSEHLQIKFATGEVLHFQDVSKRVESELMEAESVDKYIAEVLLLYDCFIAMLNDQPEERVALLC